WLTIKYGEENVFLDVDQIPLGQNFKETLQESLDQSDVVLIIVGDRWVDELKKREEDRISDANYVYVEIMRALDKAIPLIIPIMLNKTSDLKRDDLPQEMQKITSLQYGRVRDNPDFHTDMDKIRQRIDERFPSQSPEPQILNRPLRNQLYAIGGVVGTIITLILFVLLPNTIRSLTALPPPEATFVARETANAIETEITIFEASTADAAVRQEVLDVENRETQTQVFRST
ncbi:MAG: TIR domain-containing protein, partial [Chloroflexota bacterium]